MDQIRKSFGAINKDNNIRIQSSSGGVFTIFASYILEQGGVVFGAAISEDCYSVEHFKISDISMLDKLRSSKYVQSRMKNSFREAKACLDQGILVYFTGTPCQIAGLKTYLGKEYSNLFTQDLVCHGSPSQKVWECYIRKLEKKNNSKSKEVNFRYKKNGSKVYSLRVLFDNGKVYYSDKNNDLYLRGYLSNLFLKPACYECQFKGLDRESDITLADFWGVEKYTPQLGSDGVSLVTLHTQKGIDLFNKINMHSEFVEVNDEPMIANSCSIQSSDRPNSRDSFWMDFDKLGEKTFEKYFSLSIIEKTKGLIKRLIDKLIKVLKKIPKNKS